jgi:hypothetical protein
MSVLRNLEGKIAGLVEGTFGRVFRSEVRPVELARGLAKEMEEHKTRSLSRVYVPNEYVVWLSPEDREKLGEVESEVADELAVYLLEHARREKLDLVSRPQVSFNTDDALRLGEFGVQARLVKVREDAAHPRGGPQAEQAEHGHTMVYSTSDRLREELDRPRGPAGGHPHPSRAMMLAEGKRLVLGPGGGSIGRSRDCEIVLADPNVSRHHAEVRPDGGYGWVVRDLGSTNGTKKNGRPVRGTEPLEPGDRLTLGTAEIRFVVE